MSKEDIEKIDNELKSYYNGYDVRIILYGIVHLSLEIKKLKSFVSEKTILLSNGETTEMNIDSYFVSNIEVTEENILISMIRGSKIIIKKIEEGKKIEDNRKRIKRKNKNI